MGLINLLEQLTDHREMLLVFTRVSKDTDEHPDGRGVWGWLPFPLVPEPLLHISVTISVHCFLHPCFPAPPGGLEKVANYLAINTSQEEL